jgi:hypothetical protein
MFSIKLLKIFKIWNNYKYFSYKCFTFYVNICSLQTNNYTNRSLSFCGIVPVLSVGAYTKVEYCVLSLTFSFATML